MTRTYVELSTNMSLPPKTPLLLPTMPSPFQTISLGPFSLLLLLVLVPSLSQDNLMPLPSHPDLLAVVGLEMWDIIRRLQVRQEARPGTRSNESLEEGIPLSAPVCQSSYQTGELPTHTVDVFFSSSPLFLPSSLVLSLSFLFTHPPPSNPSSRRKGSDGSALQTRQPVIGLVDCHSESSISDREGWKLT